MKAAFPQERPFGERAVVEQHVPGNATAKPFRRGTVSEHLLGVSRKGPLCGTEPIGVMGDVLTDTFEKIDVHRGIKIVENSDAGRTECRRGWTTEEVHRI
jgi:hypothetical protein